MIRRFFIYLNVIIICFLMCIVLAIVIFAGCTRKMNFNNGLPKVVVKVEIVYDENNVQLKTEPNIAVESDYKFYSKDNHTEIKKLSFGDELEVYYEDYSFAKIDHILVVSPIVEKCILKEIPGSENKDYLFEEQFYSNSTANRYLVSNGIEYVINKDGSLTHKNEFNDKTSLFVVYRNSEIETDENGDFLVYAVALLSYNPKA